MDLDNSLRPYIVDNGVTVSQDEELANGIKFMFQMNLLHNVYKILLMLLYQSGSLNTWTYISIFQMTICSFGTLSMECCHKVLKNIYKLSVTLTKML